jgi:hypothetical protein
VDTTLDTATPMRSRATSTPEQLLAAEAYTREQYPQKPMTCWSIGNRTGTSNDRVLAFANISANSNDGKGKQQDKFHITTCHKCGIKRHYANECPKLEKERGTGVGSPAADGRSGGQRI